MRGPHGLRFAAGAGGEDEGEQAVRGHLGTRERGARVCAEERGPPRTVEVDHGYAEVEAVDQRRVPALREHDPAVGERGVPGEGLAAAGGIEPHDDRPRERRGAEQQ
ncbi:hypothetical protein MTP03_42880 [Tsukamurella sp. PLM1]|nr:hypothetical protein MTP03_42880 [Tsukamurella sp. PLM1]